MPTVAISEIETQSRKALEAAGAAPWIAAHVAHATAMSEAHGNVICGLYYLESYCLQLRSGRVQGDVEPEVTRPRPGAVLCDAKLGFAQPAFARGLPTALDAARETGSCVFSVAHSHTCTSLGYFTEQIARAGFIAIGATNASAIVAPPGGNARVLGTNPMAFSVPAPEGGLALHFDSSTSATALGAVTMAKAAGHPIPEGWAVDADGAPTTDPEAALAGSLMSAAGYKGFGFGLMAEVLASVLTASAPSTAVKGLKLADGVPHDLGQTYLILDPSVFADGFSERMQALSDAVSAQEGARLPGSARAPMEAVDVPDALWETVQKLAAA
ncbi:MAG: Ldh family oxidoreductase [Pseudomonadota bacterium]